MQLIMLKEGVNQDRINKNRKIKDKQNKLKEATYRAQRRSKPRQN